ncbi:predicted protein [Thalassiosira pseudonana CCMP1335]|uniref:Uncharacterized protein n=1 Tax=Thalassiosira pseudonana TaxID=35128 RepID=B8LBM1_THAPS|nr:predicted protein [Thalassiosira pseudonana CCMP1335]EED87207.1 predicted protein [Thalassiosira pseudonana CCMP1335]
MCCVRGLREAEAHSYGLWVKARSNRNFPRIASHEGAPTHNPIQTNPTMSTSAAPAAAAPFSIGTSSSVAAPANVDMSLDDLIKTRRSQDAPPRRTARNNAGKRNDVKTTTKNAAAAKKPTAAARATGGNKARRSAGMAAKRGLLGGNRQAPGQPLQGKANAMDVEREVYRAQRRGGEQRRASDIRAKEKARKANLSTAASKAIKAPTQQAIGAAARAMKEFGFKAPKGMQMQISFVPNPSSSVGGGNQRGNNNQGGGGGRGGNQRNNNQASQGQWARDRGGHQQQQQQGRGGRGGGRNNRSGGGRGGGRR